MASIANIENQSSEIPTADQLVDRARALIPTLKSRAKQCTADRNVPAETIAEMTEAGFFKILQPIMIKLSKLSSSFNNRRVTR